MAREHVFEQPERFVVGTVGQPGEREFYLQVVDHGEVVTVGLEKAEVAALAEGMVTLLAQAGVADELVGRPALLDAAPLATPFAEAFRVMELSVAWDGERVVVEAGGPPVDGEPSESAVPRAPTRLRVALTVPDTYAFVSRAERVVAAGRPDCVLCGRPDGPASHFCPRLN